MSTADRHSHTKYHSLSSLGRKGDVLSHRTRIGLAMSQDGRNWARIEADHHTGALFDAGEPQDWDECLNGAPQVVCFKCEPVETPLFLTPEVECNALTMIFVFTR